MSLEEATYAGAYPVEVEGREVVLLAASAGDGPDVGRSGAQQEVSHVLQDDGGIETPGGLLGQVYVGRQIWQRSDLRVRRACPERRYRT